MKNKRIRNFGFSLIGFFLFFLTITFTSTLCIFVYYLVSKASNGNIWAVGFSVLGMIIIGALLCTLFDIFRRKTMVEKPVKKILEATKKIASGDFSVRIDHSHDYTKFDEYDLIFDNINTMTAELSKNEILKNDFISNVSHEIKTPLTVIQNYAKALQSNKLAKEKKEECLNSLVSQTNKLSSLISNILKLNKLENQKIIPEYEEFDLAELLRQTALQNADLIDKKGLILECDIDEMRIVGSETLIEIILSNLITNAIKFTQKGKISISLKEENNLAVIKIQDTGCGMSKEVGERIFDKFYQGETSRTSEGNGLGLSLVKKVIDVIGGEIAVESKVGKGSTFTLKVQKQ